MADEGRDALGDRMKAHEFVTRYVLPRRAYTIIRVDGRAFHSYLRDADKPFDFQLATDFGAAGTQPWFGGVLAKVVSMSAAIATARLNSLRPGRALFDARVFTIADPAEVGNYFIWRQRDAVRNSVSMAAQAHFSQRQLHGVNGAQMQEMLWSQRGVNWNDYPPAAKRGQVAVKHSGERAVTYTDKRSGEEHTTTAMRSWWEVEPAEHFTLNDGWLVDAIPTMESRRTDG